MALDDADKKFIGELLANALKGEDLGALIGGAVKREIAGLKLDEKFKAVDEKVTAAAKAKEEEPPAGGKGGKGDDKAGKGDTDPRIAAQIAKLEKDLEEQKSARLRAEEKEKSAKLEGSARDALIKAGVPAERVGHAMAFIHNAQNRVRFDDKGAVGLHFQREGYEEIVPIEKGVAEWLKTTDGKAFLPPSGAQGTGTGAGARSGGPSSGSVKPADLVISLG